MGGRMIKDEKIIQRGSIMHDVDEAETNTKMNELTKDLDQQVEFNLSDDITVNIHVADIEEWAKESKKASKLSKDKNEKLKIILASIGEKRQLTRQDISKIIQEISKPNKVPKMRQSGHFIDEKLKYSKNDDSQLTLFESLSPYTKQKIIDSKLEIKAEGIDLTPSQHKLIHALTRLLHEKSPNQNPRSEDFYSGNVQSGLVPYGGPNSHAKASVIRFRPAELYKAYIGHEEYSGHDMKYIKGVMSQLETMKVLIKYDRVKRVFNGKKEETLTDRIEDFQPLIKIINYYADLTEEEKFQLDQGNNSTRDERGEYIVALNPIFTDQIGTKYVEFPVDINRRLVIAAGGHSKVTASMERLMQWMLREMSSKRFVTEINDTNLPKILGLEKFVQQNRKKYLKERIEKDVTAIINLGIISSVEKQLNSTGGIKWVFTLNKDYA
jgi:hypothetical protein